MFVLQWVRFGLKNIFDTFLFRSVFEAKNVKNDRGENKGK